VTNAVATYVDEILSASCPYSIIRHWTVTDANGNSATCDQSIILFDTTAPGFEDTPTHIVVSCDGEIPTINVVDDCTSSDVVTSFTDTEFSGTCYPTIERVYRAVDFCGNESMFIQYISVVDTIAPVISGIPATLSVQCSEVPASNPIITDNCTAELLVSFDESIVSQNCNQVITRVWTAMDQCGNGTLFTQTITVADTESPVFTFVPADLQLYCGSAVPASSATAIDNCGNTVVTSTDIAQNTPGACLSIMRVFRAIDDCGNEAMAVQTFTFIDDIAPVFSSTPESFEGDCNSLTAAPVLTASDNCDANVVVNFVESSQVAGCITYIFRTWSAVDNCGNSIVHEQMLTLVDIDAPVFSGQSEISVSCDDLFMVGITAEDACTGNVVVTYEDIVSGEGCSYDLNRTWTAMDACGNVSTFNQVIHVVDNEAPVFGYLPSTISTSCVAPPAQSPTVTDNCTSGIIPTLVQTVSGSGCSQVITRTWTAVDACGNTTVRTQTINVSDNVAPVLAGVPFNMTLSCNQVPAAPTVTATDNCTPNITVMYSESVSGEGCNYHLVRTWSATDACGNTAVASQTIFINDNVAPTWTNVPQNVTLSCGGIAPSSSDPIPADNCSGVVDFYFYEFEESVACGSILHRVWTASDECGNTSSIDQTISIVDTNAPVFANTPPALISASCGNIPAAVAPVATDDCSSVNVEFNEYFYSSGCPYVIRRTWIATDACGNESIFIQDIQVSDNEAPVLLNVPQNTTIACGESLPLSSVTASDNCATNLIVNVTITTAGSACSQEYTRVWSVQDLCGNVATATQVIYVLDEAAPVLSGMPSDAVVTCGNIPVPSVLTANDACQGAVDVVYTEETTTLTSEAPCELLTPDSPFGDVVLWLPGLNGIGANYAFGSIGGVLTRNAVNGTAHVTGQVYNTIDPNQSWIVELNLSSKRDWTEWSALGRSYKDDYDMAGSNYLDWEYYELDPSSTLTGADALAGSLINLSHAPVSYYYGFQIGVAANNKNTENGMSGWMLYSGTVNGAPVSGHGDFFAVNNCCPEQQIVRQWTATDCAGNTVSHTQVITVGQPSPVMPMMAMAQEVQPQLAVNHATDLTFTLNYEVPADSYITIELYNSVGQIIDVVYSGLAVANTKYTLDHPNTGIENGMFFFKLNTDKQSVMKPALMLR
jgi:hypothetical protein